MGIVKMSKNNKNSTKKSIKVDDETEELRLEFVDKIKRRSKQKPVDFKF
jgi:hypothetical protein